MSRLIDADALIKFIDCGHLRHPSELCYSELDVVNMITHTSTAYDLDKVVEQLEEKRSDLLESTDYENDVINYCLDWFDTAIQIVKRGGIDAD